MTGIWTRSVLHSSLMSSPQLFQALGSKNWSISTLFFLWPKQRINMHLSVPSSHSHSWKPHPTTHNCVPAGKAVSRDWGWTTWIHLGMEQAGTGPTTSAQQHHRLQTCPFAMRKGKQEAWEKGGQLRSPHSSCVSMRKGKLWPCKRRVPHTCKVHRWPHFLSPPHPPTQMALSIC